MKIDLTTRDTATPLLAQIAAHLTRRTDLHSAMGRRGEVELRAHFQRREDEPNKSGWPSQHFWSRIVKATTYVSADESGALVTVDDEALAQKIHGGTILPGPGKTYLAIPAIAEAYGRKPKGLHNLHLLIRWRDGQRRAVALVENYATQLKVKRRKGGVQRVGSTVTGGTVWYWLVKSVTQHADPRALPADEQYVAALVDEARDFMDQLGVSSSTPTPRIRGV